MQCKRAGGRILAAAVVLLLVVNGVANAGEKPCRFIVAWDPYEPYSYADEEGEPAGYDIDVIRKVAGSVGCELKFVEMAWSEILVALEEGEVDVTVGTGYKPQRATWSWYSESYRREIVGLLMRADDVRRYRDLDLSGLLDRGLVFGLTTDDTYDATTRALIERYADQIRPRVSEERNLERLLDRQIDVFLVEKYVAAAIARHKGVSGELDFLPHGFDAGAYRLQFSRKTVPGRRVAEFNAALQSLASNGWLDEALEAYEIR